MTAEQIRQDLGILGTFVCPRADSGRCDCDQPAVCCFLRTERGQGRSLLPAGNFTHAHMTTNPIVDAVTCSAHVLAVGGAPRGAVPARRWTHPVGEPAGGHGVEVWR